MSVFEDILVELRDCLQESDEFKNINVYYDDSEMNSNTSLPAISFKVGKREVVEYCVDGVECVRHIEIRLHTKTTDKRKLQSELYDYEEHLSKLISRSKGDGSIANFYEINEIGARSIQALMYNAKKEANQFNMVFFSNLLRVSFDIRYRI